MSAGKSTADSWLVFNIGCIECGVSSNVVGVYSTQAEATRIAEICERQLNWREGGQNAFGVFNLSAPQSNEYAAAIAKSTGQEGGAK